jgi:hypothetical protein
MDNVCCSWTMTASGRGQRSRPKTWTQLGMRRWELSFSSSYYWASENFLSVWLTDWHPSTRVPHSSNDLMKLLSSTRRGRGRGGGGGEYCTSWATRVSSTLMAILKDTKDRRWFYWKLTEIQSFSIFGWLFGWLLCAVWICCPWSFHVARGLGDQYSEWEE